MIRDFAILGFVLAVGLWIQGKVPAAPFHYIAPCTQQQCVTVYRVTCVDGMLEKAETLEYQRDTKDWIYRGDRIRDDFLASDVYVKNVFGIAYTYDVSEIRKECAMKPTAQKSQTTLRIQPRLSR